MLTGTVHVPARCAQHRTDGDFVGRPRRHVARIHAVLGRHGEHQPRLLEPLAEPSDQTNRFIEGVGQILGGRGRRARLEAARDRHRDLEGDRFLLGHARVPVAHLAAREGQVLRGEGHLRAEQQHRPAGVEPGQDQWDRRERAEDRLVGRGADLEIDVDRPRRGEEDRGHEPAERRRANPNLGIREEPVQEGEPEEEHQDGYLLEPDAVEPGEGGVFEEAARDYIVEMRTVQPRGPYFLGGFSGGGYIALEIAKQLREAGEQIGLLVMLDTPGNLIPEPLTWRDRMTIQKQRLEQKGAQYVVEWAQARIDWEIGKLRRRFEAPEVLGQEVLHDQAIEAAFRRSLARYSIPRWDGIVLFRPPLPKVYDLGNGRCLNKDRELVYEDNAWSRHCDRVEVIEVPGDHDSMVLEPNVRVMVAKLRAFLEAAEAACAPNAATVAEVAQAGE